MAETQNLKLQIPELTETADGPDAFRDMAQGIEDYVYNRILPTGVLRAPEAYWGASGSLPNNAAVRVGDTATHTGLRSLMVCIGLTANGPTWDQLRPATVATLAERNVISSQFKDILPFGFTVIQDPTGQYPRVWEWRAYYWHLVGGHPPMVTMYRIGAGSISGLVWTNIGMESNRGDPWGMMQGGGFMVAPLTGIYRFSAQLTYAVNNVGDRGMRFYKNQPNPTGSVPIAGSSGLIRASNSVFTSVVSPTVLLPLVAGDNVIMQGYQNGASSLGVIGTNEEATQNTFTTYELAYQNG